MVIGFYPGAGGHRYYNWVTDKKRIDVKNVTYDNAPTDYNTRYATNNLVSHYTDSTSHCVNYDTLKNCFVNNSNGFTIIVGDLKRCLYRYYCLTGKEHYLKNQKSNDTELEIITHYQAYKDSSWPQVQTIDQYKKLPAHIKDEVESNRNQVMPNIDYLAAESIIKFHHDYYTKYPLQIGNAMEVNIDHNDNFFCEVMRQELSVPFTDEYNQAWENVVG